MFTDANSIEIDDKIKLPPSETLNQLYNLNRNRKGIRILTVAVYVLSVSLTAIILSIYYLFVWDPNEMKTFTHPPIAVCDKIVISELIAIQLLNTSEEISAEEFYKKILYYHRQLLMEEQQKQKLKLWQLEQKQLQVNIMLHQQKFVNYSNYHKNILMHHHQQYTENYQEQKQFERINLRNNTFENHLNNNLTELNQLNLNNSAFQLQNSNLDSLVSLTLNKTDNLKNEILKISNNSLESYKNNYLIKNVSENDMEKENSNGYDLKQNVTQNKLLLLKPISRVVRSKLLPSPHPSKSSNLFILNNNYHNNHKKLKKLYQMAAPHSVNRKRFSNHQNRKNIITHHKKKTSISPSSLKSLLKQNNYVVPKIYSPNSINYENVLRNLIKSNLAKKQNNFENHKISHTIIDDEDYDHSGSGSDNDLSLQMSIS